MINKFKQNQFIEDLPKLIRSLEELFLKEINWDCNKYLSHSGIQENNLSSNQANLLLFQLTLVYLLGKNDEEKYIGIF